MIVKPTFPLFWTFLKSLGKEWILWLSIALEVVGIFIQLFIPAISIPRGIYISIFIIGLIWSSFKTYLDLLARIPEESIPLQPDIDISFTKGNEYSYKIDVNNDIISLDTLKTLDLSPLQQDQAAKALHVVPTLPRSIITLNIQIENIGFVPVNILNITGRINADKPFNFLIPHICYTDENPVTFPVKLDSKSILRFIFITNIDPLSLLSDAQIAARIRKLKDERISCAVNINSEVIDSQGNIHNYKNDYQISLLPLCDLYITLWDRIGRYDLSSIAIGKVNSIERNTSSDGS